MSKEYINSHNAILADLMEQEEFNQLKIKLGIVDAEVAKKANLSELNDKFTTVNTELNKKATVDSVETNKSNLSSISDELREKVTISMFESNQEKFDSLRSELGTITYTINSNNIKLSNLSSVNDKLSKITSMVDTNKEELNKKLSSVSDELREKVTISMFESNQGKFDSLRSELGTITYTINSNNIKLSNLSSVNDKLSKITSMVDTNKEELNKKLSSVSNELNKVTISMFESNQKELNKKLSSVSDELSERAFYVESKQEKLNRKLSYVSNELNEKATISMVNSKVDARLSIAEKSNLFLKMRDLTELSAKVSTINSRVNIVEAGIKEFKDSGSSQGDDGRVSDK